jgi:hypothetical protein
MTKTRTTRRHKTETKAKGVPRIDTRSFSSSRSRGGVENEGTGTLRRKFSVSFLPSSENSATPTIGVENDRTCTRTCTIVFRRFAPRRSA